VDALRPLGVKHLDMPLRSSVILGVSGIDLKK
jgi:hypothetical protein